ncbi:hypothetical protein AMTRI_Chr01g129980 [Amborella trichopoda]
MKASAGRSRYVRETATRTALQNPKDTRGKGTKTAQKLIERDMPYCARDATAQPRACNPTIIHHPERVMSRREAGLHLCRHGRAISRLRRIGAASGHPSHHHPDTNRDRWRDDRHPPPKLSDRDMPYCARGATAQPQACNPTIIHHPERVMSRREAGLHLCRHGWAISRL